MSKKAMKLALESLKANQPINYCMNNHGEKFPMFSNDPIRKESNEKAIKALEEALAKQEQVKSSCFRCNSPKKCAVHGCSPLTWPSEKQEQRNVSEHLGEPVAVETVYETIIHWDEGGGKRSRRELAGRIVALYTTPQQRKPLTRAEIINAVAVAFSFNSRDYDEIIEPVARAIEAAHGIKE